MNVTTHSNVLSLILLHLTKVLLEIANLNESFIIERLTNELNDEIMKVWDTLMGLELQLVDQLEETIKDFERNLADLYSGFLEQIRAQYPFARIQYTFRLVGDKPVYEVVKFFSLSFQTKFLLRRVEAGSLKL